MSTPEEHKGLVRHWMKEVWSKRNLDYNEEFIAPGAILHDAASSEPVQGPNGARAQVEAMLSAFPDTTVEIEHIVAEGDTVAVHFRATGAHQGPFMGVPPTGRRIEVQGTSFLRLRNEQLVEEWQVFDALSLLVQIGGVELPAQE